MENRLILIIKIFLFITPIFIIFLLFFLPKMLCTDPCHKIKVTKYTIFTIENRINYFMKSNNRLPNVNEYLELNQSALDSYGNALTFKKNGESFKVYSLGSNEKDENGKGDDIFIVDEERESKKFQCEEKTKQGWNFCPAISKP